MVLALGHYFASHIIPGDDATGFGECVLPTLTSGLPGQMGQWDKVIGSLIVQNDDIPSLIALSTSNLSSLVIDFCHIFTLLSLQSWCLKTMKLFSYHSYSLFSVVF